MSSWISKCLNKFVWNWNLPKSYASNWHIMWNGFLRWCTMHNKQPLVEFCLFVFYNFRPNILSLFYFILFRLMSNAAFYASMWLNTFSKPLHISYDKWLVKKIILLVLNFVCILQWSTFISILKTFQSNFYY